jgi:putative tryptophan/tyrosine transport system substrate-binding protein
MTIESMKRREFITLLGAAAAAASISLPRVASAQQPAAKVPRIGIIDDSPAWNSFRRGLRDLGYLEGHNIAFEYRYADGAAERLAEAAADLARRPVDLIATYGTLATRAAKQATTTIPIVMIGIGDPVRAQLVESFGRPGGNVTGNTIMSPDLSAKRLQLLKELIPSVARVAFLWNGENASNLAIWEELRAAAPAAGVTLISVDVRNVADLDGAFVAMMRERPDAFLMTSDPLLQLHFEKVVDFLAQQRLPGLFQARENVVAGGFMSYGASLPDLFRRGASYAHRILQGTKPAELPIEDPAKFELVVNLNTAKALGLTIPESFLLRVDEVIE